MSKLIVLLGEAIAHFEGYYSDANHLARRNNNPGNLRGWSKQLPKSEGGYDIFSAPIFGFSALHRQIEKNIDRGLTLHEFFAGKKGVYPGYAPASDSNPVDNYVAFVEKFLADRGIPIDKHDVLKEKE